MPNRIKAHLKRLDTLRDRTDKKTDEMMNKIADNIDLLIAKPKEFLRGISIEWLKKEKNLFSQARKEGKRLRHSI